MQRAVWAFMVGLAVVAGGCGVGVTVDRSGDAVELRKLDEQWSAAAAKNDLEATLSVAEVTY